MKDTLASSVKRKGPTKMNIIYLINAIEFSICLFMTSHVTLRRQNPMLLYINIKSR
jgi:hypothetical protein